MITLTPDETRNGWTAAALEAYRAAREQAAGCVAGNTPTQYERPKPAIQVEPVKTFNPHKWMR